MFNIYNFKDLKINSIIIFKEDTKEIIAKIKEDGFETREGFNILLDSYSEENVSNELVSLKDILFFKNNPQETYLVTQINQRFFYMTKLTIVDDELTLDTNYILAYPNSKLFGTLDELGLEKLNMEEE
jgi:hypothetical protein